MTQSDEQKTTASERCQFATQQPSKTMLTTSPHSPYFNKNNAQHPQTKSPQKRACSQKVTVDCLPSTSAATQPGEMCVELEEEVEDGLFYDAKAVISDNDDSDEDIFSDYKETVEHLETETKKECETEKVQQTEQSTVSTENDSLEFCREVSDMLSDALDDTETLKSVKDDEDADYEMLMCEESEETKDQDMMPQCDNALNTIAAGVVNDIDDEDDDEMLVRVMNEVEQNSSETDRKKQYTDIVNKPANNQGHTSYQSPAKYTHTSSASQSTPQKGKSPRRGGGNKLKKPENNKSILSFFKPKVSGGNLTADKKIELKSAATIPAQSVIKDYDIKENNDSGKSFSIFSKPWSLGGQRTSKAGTSSIQPSEASVSDAESSTSSTTSGGWGQRKRPCPFYKKMPGNT